MKATSVVFFGTGPISRATLEGISDTFQIEAVITKADSKSASDQLIESPVKTWASLHNITVFQPRDKAELSQLIEEHAFTSSVGLVVDYGLIIPKTVIDSFPKGIINSHFSLLPQWRGADPITQAIVSGATKTGVSLMLIEEGLDTGPLIAQFPLPLSDNITIDQLEKQLVKLSNKLIQSTIPSYMKSEIIPWEQDKSVEPTYTKKLSKADGLVDWQLPAVTIERQIRAYLGWPGSHTTIGGKDVIVTTAHVENLSGQPGQAFKHGKELAVYCSQDALVIDRLKPAGKREMAGREFLAGNTI